MWHSNYMAISKNKDASYPIEPFAGIVEWEQWLKEHYTDMDGVWIKIAKKATGILTVTHDQALDVALCYGWIDGLSRTFDDVYFLQKFTPRRPRSLWSKRNIEKTEQLVVSGKMQPAGIAEIEAAKKDGRWAAAYDSVKNMQMPADFIAVLQNNPKALAFFNSLNKTNTYAIAWRLATAKRPETRQRRMDIILAMLERGEKLH
jgi:uncharacterized protein YdeI (YjbR/CyaY-like superfamily)